MGSIQFRLFSFLHTSAELSVCVCSNIITQVYFICALRQVVVVAAPQSLWPHCVHHWSPVAVNANHGLSCSSWLKRRKKGDETASRRRRWQCFRRRRRRQLQLQRRSCPNIGQSRSDKGSTLAAPPIRVSYNEAKVRFEEAASWLGD